jgi:hypothetical protein
MSVLTITIKIDRQAAGVSGVTRRGSHTGEHGRPLEMSFRTTDRYKETKFCRVSRGVGVAHSTATIPKTTQLREREGAIPSSRFGRREGKGDCIHAKNSG